MTLLIKNCEWIITQNSARDILRGTSVFVEDGLIKEIGSKVSSSANNIIDGSKKILIPGLINTHTHLPMTLLRGYADDMELHEWLTKKIWPTEARLTAEACHYGALLGCVELIHTGTTTFVDMYFFMEKVAEAAKQAGLRAYLSPGLIDVISPDVSAKLKSDMERFAKFVRSLNSNRVKFVAGPHSAYSCTEETLVWARDLALRENAILNIHVAETRKEQADSQKKHGMRVVEYLDKLGLLGPNTIAAHCVWLTRSEIRLMAARQAKASHCPVSNMKIATGGTAPVPEMLADGVTVSLGTDGAASNNTLDMFESMKFCALAHKAHRWDPTVLPAQKVLDIATLGGAAAIGVEDKLGSIEVGKIADLILVDMKSANFVPVHGKDTVVSNLVYSARGLNVDTTIVDGQVLMENRRLLTLDEEEVFAGAQNHAVKMTSG